MARLDTSLKVIEDPNASEKVCFQDTMWYTFSGATDFSRCVFVPLKSTFADALTFASLGYFYRQTFASAFCQRENESTKVKQPLLTHFEYFPRRVDAPIKGFIFVVLIFLTPFINYFCWKIKLLLYSSSHVWHNIFFSSNAYS